MADMNTITSFEGRVVNLDNCDTFNIESHTVSADVFQVKAHPSKNAGATNAHNLFQGTQAECKAYFRDTLAPKLNLDTDDPHFIAHYGEPPGPEPKTKTTRGTKKADA